MTEIVSPIPSRIKNAAVGGHVCGTEDIIDDIKNKTQSEINAELEEQVNNSSDFIKLLNLTDTAPAQCATGDKYYNTNSKKIFTAIDTNTWDDTGADPDTSRLYVNLNNNNTYRWNGTDMTPLGNPDVYSKNEVNGLIATERERAQGVEAMKANVNDVNTALEGKQNTINDLSAIRSGAAAGATAQQPATTLAGYGITDGYTKAEGQALEDSVAETLAEQDSKINLLNGSEVIVVPDHTAVSNPNSQKIYRQYGTTSYTDWMYQNGAWQDIATYSMPGIDNEPEIGSEKLVKSGGVAKIIFINDGEGDAILGYYLAQNNQGTVTANADFWITPYIYIGASETSSIWIVNPLLEKPTVAVALIEYDNSKNPVKFQRLNNINVNSSIEIKNPYIRFSVPINQKTVAFGMGGITQEITSLPYSKPLVVSDYKYKILESHYAPFVAAKNYGEYVNNTGSTTALAETMFYKIHLKKGDTIVFNGHRSFRLSYPLSKKDSNTFTQLTTTANQYTAVTGDEEIYISDYSSEVRGAETYCILTNDISWYTIGDAESFARYISTFELTLPENSGNTSITKYLNIPADTHVKIDFDVPASVTLTYAKMDFRSVSGMNNTGDLVFEGNMASQWALINKKITKLIFNIRGVSAACTATVTIKSDKKIENIGDTPLYIDSDYIELQRCLNMAAATRKNNLLQFVHVSDPHGAFGDYPAFTDWSDAEFLALTGDMVADKYSDDYYADGINAMTKPCFVVLGNHDVNQSPSLQARFDKFIAPINAHNGLIGNTKTYYKVDYTSKNIRCIYLDQWDALKPNETVTMPFDMWVMSDEQVQWFIGQLQDAITNGLHVILFAHSTPSLPHVDTINNWSDIDYCAWTDNSTASAGSNYAEWFMNLIDAFIGANGIRAYNLTNPQTGTTYNGEFTGANGIFVGWFVGHSHYGLYGFPDNHKKQFISTITRFIVPGNVRDSLITIGQNTTSEERHTLDYVVVDTFIRKVTTIKVGVKTKIDGTECEPFSVFY